MAAVALEQPWKLMVLGYVMTSSPSFILFKHLSSSRQRKSYVTFPFFMQQAPVILAGNEAQKKKYLTRMIEEPLMCVSSNFCGFSFSLGLFFSICLALLMFALFL